MKKFAFTILFMGIFLLPKNISASNRLSVMFFGPEFNFNVEIGQDSLILESNTLDLKFNKKYCNRYIFDYTRAILKEILNGANDKEIDIEKDTSVRITSSEKIKNVPYLSRSSKLLQKFISRAVSFRYEEEYACKK